MTHGIQTGRRGGAGGNQQQARNDRQGQQRNDRYQDSAAGNRGGRGTCHTNQRLACVIVTCTTRSLDQCYHLSEEFEKNEISEIREKSHLKAYS